MVTISYNLEATKSIFSLAVQEQKRHNDSIYLIAGEEGSGKSHLLLTAFDEIDKLKETQTNIENVTRTLKELIIKLKITQNGETIGLDEGSELASDRQYDQVVKAIKKVFTVMRAKSLIVFICFTNPMKVNTYFREDRVKGVFFLKKRGEIYFYPRTRFQNIMEEVRKSRAGIKSIKTFIQYQPAFIDHFPAYTGRLLQDYNRRKNENMNDIIDELYDEFGVDERQYSTGQICKMLRMDDKLLMKYVKVNDEDPDPDHVLTPIWNLARTKRKFKESDVLNFRIWFENQRLLRVDKTIQSVSEENQKKMPDDETK